MLALFVVWFVLITVTDAANCGANITAEEPRYVSRTSLDKIHVLTVPFASDLTSCKWRFSNAAKFLLNFFFVNITVPSSSLLPSCADNYASIRTHDAEKGVYKDFGQYCGEKRLSAIRINGSVEIELHYKKRLSGDFVMAVRIESSSKGCGGLFDGSRNGFQVRLQHSNFDTWYGDFFHCLWYFEQSDMKKLNLFLAQSPIKNGYRRDCKGNKDFISIRSWNGSNGVIKEEKIDCKVGYSLPKQYFLEESKHFAVTIHLEHQYAGHTGDTDAICIFATNGYTFEKSLVGTETGNQTFRLANETNKETTDALIVLKSKNSWKSVEYDVLLNEVGFICRTGVIKAWSLHTDQFQVNNTLCQICGGVFHLEPKQNLEVLSPTDGFGKYPSNLFCQWIVLASGTTKLSISISHMDLESCRREFYDYVEIYENYRRNETLKYKFCVKPNNDIIVNGDVVIHFHSDRSSQKSGFRMTIDAVSVCGGSFELIPGQNVNISSPNFGIGAYPAYSKCQWTFYANETTRLNVSFSSIDLESCSFAFYDFVEIYHGVNQKMSLKNKFCQRPADDVIVDGNMTVRFHSDGLISKNGFKIIVYATKVPPTVPTTAPFSSTSGKKLLSSDSHSKCCSSLPVSSLPSRNATTNGIKIKKFKESSPSNVAAYATGVAVGIFVVICALVVAIVFLRRRRNAERMSVPPPGANDVQKKRDEVNGSVPMQTLDGIVENQRYGFNKSQVAIMESENPYYTSNPETGTDNLYYDSNLESTEAVYALADDENHVYADPHAKEAEYTYANRIPAETNSYDRLNCAKSNTEHTIGRNENDVYDHIERDQGREIQTDFYDHLERKEMSDDNNGSDVYNELHRDTGGL